MKTVNPIGYALLLTVILLTVGCATSSPSATRTTIAATPREGRGRITFYRPGGIFGYAQRAHIFLDGNQVGNSAPGVKFFVDTTPGIHHVSIPNMMYPGEHTLDVAVRNKETTYVKTSLGGTAFGGRTNIELVGSSQGAQETANLKLVNY